MARKRNLRYFAKQKALQKDINKMSKLYLGMAMQASFPDSGYYYSGKQRELDKLHDKILHKVKKDRWQRIWRHLENEYSKLWYNYNEEVQIIDKNGRAWTASDMDNAMVYGN